MTACKLVNKNRLKKAPKPNHLTPQVLGSAGIEQVLEVLGSEPFLGHHVQLDQLCISISLLHIDDPLANKQDTHSLKTKSTGFFTNLL